MVAGDEGDGLLRLALVGLPSWGDQRREMVRVGRVLPGWPRGRKSRGQVPSLGDRCDFINKANESNARACRRRAMRRPHAPLLLQQHFLLGRDHAFGTTPPHSQGNSCTGVACPQAGTDGCSVRSCRHKAESWLCCCQRCSCHRTWKSVKLEERLLLMRMQSSASGCAHTPYVWGTAIPVAALGL